MSIDERDYMHEPRKGGGKSPNYQPREFRATRAAGEELFEWQRTRPPQTKPSAFGRFLVVAVVAMAVVAIIHRNDPDAFRSVKRFVERAQADDLSQEYRRQQEELAMARAREEKLSRQMARRETPAVLPERQSVVAADPCGAALPTNSGFWMHDDGVSPAAKKWFRFTNMLAMPVFLDIKRAGDDGRMATAFVMPGQSTVLTTGVTRIGLTIGQGSAWCNGLVGWRDGTRILVREGVAVEAGAVGATLELRPGEAGRGGVALSLLQSYPNQDRPRQEFDQRRGSIGAVDFPRGQSAGLTRKSNGSYVIAGHINSFPVTFMVDTGASITSVPETMGGAIGVTSCERRTFNTANGQTIGCVARVASISFGPFRVRDAEVVLMKNLTTQPLLGMNALQGLQLVNQNGSMALSRP